MYGGSSSSMRPDSARISPSRQTYGGGGGGGGSSTSSPDSARRSPSRQTYGGGGGSSMSSPDSARRSPTRQTYGGGGGSSMSSPDSARRSPRRQNYGRGFGSSMSSPDSLSPTRQTYGGGGGGSSMSSPDFARRSPTRQNRIPNVRRAASEGQRTDTTAVLSAILEGEQVTFEHVSEDIRNNKNLVLQAVRKNWENFAYASPTLKKDLDVVLAALESNDGWKALYYIPDCHHNKQFMLACVKQNPSAMQYASGPLKSDRDLVKAAIVQDCKAMGNASRSLRADKKFILSAIKINPDALQYAIPSLQNDVDLIRAVSDSCRQNNNNTPTTSIITPELSNSIKSDKWDILADAVVDGESIKNAPLELRADKKFVLTAIKQHGLAMKYAAPSLRHDKTFLMEAINENYEVFGCIPDDVKLDKEFVKQALKISGHIFEWLPSSLKRDKEIALLAVQRHWRALRYAPMLCGNRDVVMAALIQDVDALKFADKSLSRDKYFIISAIGENANVFKFASEEIRADRDVVIAAVMENGALLQHAAPSAQADRQIVIRAVTKTGTAIKYASKDLQADKRIALAACNQNGVAIRYCSNDLKADKQVALSAVTNKGGALEFVSTPLKADKSVVLAAVQETGFAYRYAHKDLKSDREVIFAAIDNDGTVLKHAPEKFKGDKTIVLRAINQTASAFEFADDSMKADKDCVCAAVKKNSDLLKLALGGLSQDRDCWIAAGLWKEEENHNDIPEFSVRIVLSTRFSLREESKSTVTEFTRRLSENPYFNDGVFYVYSPNAFNKATCDEQWTRMSWPCRGTYGTCYFEPSLKTGKPTSACCWRYSFRWHLEEARRTNGFMLQICDLEEKDGKFEYVLGDGQKIETVMAHAVGAKIFRIYRPRAYSKSQNRYMFPHFRSDHINILCMYVQDWYSRGGVDMEDCEIHIDEEW